MSVARVTEIISSSSKSVEDAINEGIKRATKTIRGIQGWEVNKINGKIEGNKVSEYRVHLNITFILEG